MVCIFVFNYGPLVFIRFFLKELVLRFTSFKKAFNGRFYEFHLEEICNLDNFIILDERDIVIGKHFWKRQFRTVPGPERWRE